MLFYSAWIIRVMGNAQMVREQQQMDTGSDNDAEPAAVSQKSKRVQAVKPSVNDGGKKKKKKNDGMAQESQLFEEDTDTDSD